MRLSGADGGGGRQTRCRVLRVALVGDPQVDDSTEMGYARRSVYRELHGRFRMTLPVVLIVCISMSSAVRQTASSASPGLDVKLILVSGVLWLPRKWSR